VNDELWDLLDEFTRYCGGPEEDVKLVLEKLATFYDDRTNMRNMEKITDELLEAVAQLTKRNISWRV
jgi:hypothetical protein